MIFAVHFMHKASEAKGFVDNFTDFFSHNTMWNPLIKFFGGEAQKEASKHDVSIWVMLIVGIILILIGLSKVLLSRKKT